MNEEEKERIKHLIERCNECKLNACITCDITWSEVQAIEKQQAEIEKKDKIIKYNKEESDKAFIYQNKIIRSMAEFMFHNYYGMTYVDEWQFEEKIQEIIGDFENKIKEDK